jgi:hypothetical protein
MVVVIATDAHLDTLSCCGAFRVALGAGSGCHGGFPQSSIRGKDAIGKALVPHHRTDPLGQRGGIGGLDPDLVSSLDREAIHLVGFLGVTLVPAMEIVTLAGILDTPIQHIGRRLERRIEVLARQEVVTHSIVSE